MKAEQNEFVLELLDSELQLLLFQFMEAAEQVLQTDTSQNLLEAYFEVKNFLKIVELLDDSYVIYGEKDKNDLKIKLFCMNPAKPLQKMGKGYRSKSIFLCYACAPLLLSRYPWW